MDEATVDKAHTRDKAHTMTGEAHRRLACRGNCRCNLGCILANLHLNLDRSRRHHGRSPVSLVVVDDRSIRTSCTCERCHCTVPASTARAGKITVAADRISGIMSVTGEHAQQSHFSVNNLSVSSYPRKVCRSYSTS